MAAATTMLVRINPNNNRASHTAHGVTITKDGGWYSVPAAIARRLAEERMNVLNPHASPLVFDVQSEDQARATVEAETIIADPAGTIDKPRAVAPPTQPKKKGYQGS